MAAKLFKGEGMGQGTFCAGAALRNPHLPLVKPHKQSSTTLSPDHIVVLAAAKLSRLKLNRDVAQYISMAFVLILLCIFPILLIRLLPSRKVMDYLKQQATATPMPDTPAVTQNQSTTPPTQSQTPAELSHADQTWRDDPWNDPNSK